MRTIVTLFIVLGLTSFGLSNDLLPEGVPEISQNHLVKPYTASPHSPEKPDGITGYAYFSIQHAINAAQNGDVVVVNPGTYYERINFKGKAITVRSAEGPETTIIDAMNLNSVVTFNHNEGTDSVLNGFTIQNGTGKRFSSMQRVGGGVLIDNASPTISHNIIEDNEASGLVGCGGGMICLGDSFPKISNNIIQNNSSAYGAGIFVSTGARPHINGNRFCTNAASTSGGAIFCYNSQGLVKLSSVQCEIGIVNPYPPPMNVTVPTVQETAVFTDSSPGSSTPEFMKLKRWPPPLFDPLDPDDVAIEFPFAQPDSALLTDNMIFNNTAGVSGGGIACDTASPIMTNNTLYSNSSQAWAGGISFFNSTFVRITNTILWKNRSYMGQEMRLEGASFIRVQFSNIKGGMTLLDIGPDAYVSWGPSMMNQDPLFIEEGCCDLHLACPSPCKNTGTLSAPELTAHDWEGDPRVSYGNVDIGADEQYSHIYYLDEATPGSSVEIRVVGPAYSSPVFLWVGSGALTNPITTMYGEWCLAGPLVLTDLLDDLDATGMSEKSYPIPPDFPVHQKVFVQVLAGDELTNMLVLEVM